MVELSEEEILKKLLEFSTPTVANVVATYPDHPLCLKLYDPWRGGWYTDQSVHCVFPEMGRRIGYAFTMVVSVPDKEHPSLSFIDLSGITPAHGDFAIRKINVPVSVAGMDVVPGDIVHMDEHGACKFPSDKLSDIYKNIEEFSKIEDYQAKALLQAKSIEEIKEAWMKRT